MCACDVEAYHGGEPVLCALRFASRVIFDAHVLLPVRFAADAQFQRHSHGADHGHLRQGAPHHARCQTGCDHGARRERPNFAADSLIVLFLSLPAFPIQGETVNLMSNDTQRIFDAGLFLHFLWIAPMQIVVALILMILEVGWAAVAGVVLMCLMVRPRVVLSNRGRDYCIKSISH